MSVLEARSPLIRCVSSLRIATVSYIYLFAHFVRNLGGNKVKFGQEHRKTQILPVVSYQYPEGNEECKWELVLTSKCRELCQAVMGNMDQLFHLDYQENAGDFGSCFAYVILHYQDSMLSYYHKEERLVHSTSSRTRRL